MLRGYDLCYSGMYVVWFGTLPSYWLYPNACLKFSLVSIDFTSLKTCDLLYSLVYFWTGKRLNGSTLVELTSVVVENTLFWSTSYLCASLECRLRYSTTFYGANEGSVCCSRLDGIWDDENGFISLESILSKLSFETFENGFELSLLCEIVRWTASLLYCVVIGSWGDVGNQIGASCIRLLA